MKFTFGQKKKDMSQWILSSSVNLKYGLKEMSLHRAYIYFESDGPVYIYIYITKEKSTPTVMDLDSLFGIQ